jgi:hypothetical protein
MPVYIAGTGGYGWIFDFSLGSDTLVYEKDFPIRLVNGKLSGVGQLMNHNNRNLDFHNELSRKYSRTKDENACNAVSAKLGVDDEKVFVVIVAPRDCFCE